MNLLVSRKKYYVIAVCVWAQGIWSGMIGGIVLQTVILLWVTIRTDWNKEVS